jgi:glycosyltransferase involved in cell wall biosynthesis
VRFLGFVNQSQLPAVYKSADIMVLPSEYEPFAVVVNEAMCCGCPVIASDRVGAVGDLVVPGRTGFVYPCGDTAALAGILKEAIADPARLETLRRGALTRMQSWSPAQNIAATVEALQVAVARVQHSPADEGVTRPAPSEKQQ